MTKLKCNCCECADNVKPRVVTLNPITTRDLCEECADLHIGALETIAKSAEAVRADDQNCLLHPAEERELS